MNIKKRNWRRIAGGMLLIVLLQVLVDPLSSLQHLAERLQARYYLPRARQKWDTQQIQHYRFDIRGATPLACIFGGGIEVREGVVIPGPRSDAGDPEAMLSPGFSKAKDPPLCSYQNYTMPGLFDLVEDWMAHQPSSINQISFDPQYGFISSFSFGNPGGNGLLNPTVSDCCGFFVIENFQALDE